MLYYSCRSNRGDLSGQIRSLVRPRYQKTPVRPGVNTTGYGYATVLSMKKER
jgi:hypothetical protein